MVVVTNDNNFLLSIINKIKGKYEKFAYPNLYELLKLLDGNRDGYRHINSIPMDVLKKD